MPADEARDAMSEREPDPPSGVVTIAMVAKEAGVSSSTVSRILTGHARVSEDKRRAVQRAIDKLRYRPNALARGLAQGRTFSIGVLTQDLGSPFYGHALRGIENALVGTGVVPLFASGHWNLDDELECMSLLLDRRVDGVIVLTGRLSEAQLRAYAARVPIVATGRDVTGPQLANLCVDDILGATLAMQHLIGLGHRRIAHIAGPPDHADALLRLSGYRQALEGAGIAPEPALVVQADLHEASGVGAIEQLLDTGTSFSAVFASNDQMAYGARLALHQRGIRVPDDVSLVGFDDLPGSRFAIPPLTSVHQPVYELGQAAAQLLLGLIEGQPAAVRLPQPELVVRCSTSPPRAA